MAGYSGVLVTQSQVANFKSTRTLSLRLRGKWLPFLGSSQSRTWKLSQGRQFESRSRQFFLSIFRTKPKHWVRAIDVTAQMVRVTVWIKPPTTVITYRQTILSQCPPMRAGTVDGPGSATQLRHVRHAKRKNDWSGPPTGPQAGPPMALDDDFASSAIKA